METDDDALTTLDDLHRRYDGPISSDRRARPFSTGEAAELLLNHEMSRLSEAVSALAARRAALPGASVRCDARLVRLEGAVVRHRARALLLLTRGR